MSPYAEGDESEPGSVTILYTASLNGNLDGCSCKLDPKAGMVKRAYYLRDLYKRLKSDVLSSPVGEEGTILLVDAGDILDKYPDEFLAREILEVYGELGYELISVGDQEFSNGIDKLMAYKREFPLISHNLTIRSAENQFTLFSPSPLIVQKGDYKIGIISLLGPESIDTHPDLHADKIKIIPPQKAAADNIRLIDDGRVDLSVLMYHGNASEVFELVQGVPGFDVVILAHEQMLLEPLIMDGSIIVSPGEQGNRIGILKLNLSKDKKGVQSYTHRFKLFEFSPENANDPEADPDDPDVRERIDRYIKSFLSLIIKDQR